MIYIIGPLEFDARRRELYRGQDPVRMTRKALDVLLYLIEHHGDWVRREELLQEVWADITVTENILAQRLSEIRQGFASHGVLPPIIEYKHGQGYRFAPQCEVRLQTTALTLNDLQPFVPGPPIMHPRQFFGRERELSELFILWQRLPLLNAAVIGPRRSGKTSLLLYLRSVSTVPLDHLRPDQQNSRAQLNPARLRWVFVNFQSPHLGRQDGLLPYLLRGLGLPVPTPCDLDRFWEVVSEGLHSPAVVLLDEIGVAMHPDATLGDRFWNSLRALSQEVEGKLGFVLASSAPIDQLAHYHRLGSPFFNIFGHTAYLGPLIEREARALIASSPIPFAPNEVEWILQTSQCWPYFVQILCQKRLSALKNGEVGDRWRQEGLQLIQERGPLGHGG
jgi:DNA-binding winged helix-turn-helix (wHTH) protein